MVCVCVCVCVVSGFWDVNVELLIGLGNVVRWEVIISYGRWCVILCEVGGHRDVNVELLIGNMQRWELGDYKLIWQMVCVCVFSVDTEM